MMPLATSHNTWLLKIDRSAPKEMIARKIAREWMEIESSHDLFEYVPEGKLGLHTMETMRAFRDEVYLPPYHAKRKVFIIYEADRLPIACANALLKTLEEPLPTSMILLVTSYPDKLIPTIRSRCQTVTSTQEENILNPHPILLHILSHLDSLPYAELIKEAQALAEALEDNPETSEESQIELNAFQKDLQERRQEGKSALNLAKRLDASFEHIIQWFRDLHLLHLQADRKYLFHKDVQALQQWVEKGLIPPLEPIFQAITDAKKNFERSAPLRSTLETLFLQLKNIFSSL